jgi:HEAT repeat protein
LKPAVEAALAKCPPDQASERQALQDALREIDQPTKRPESEFDLFSVYPEKSLPIFEAIDVENLAPYLTSTDEGWRIGAAERLIDEEYPDSIRDLLLERVETDENVMVRAASLRALAGRNKESKIRDLLIKMISDTSLPEVLRGAGLIGLATRSTLPEFQKAVVELYEADGVARMFALEAMWQSSDLRFRKYFAPNLRHEDVDVRRQAIQGVGAYPIEELASELVPLFSDEEVRDDALFAYSMAVPAKVNPKTVEKLYREITEKVDDLC